MATMTRTRATLAFMSGLALALPAASAPGAEPEADEAPDPAKPRITNPDWLRKPSPGDVYANFPSKAVAKGKSGYAIIKCSVTVEGLLTACVIRKEAPEGYGFGEAALRMSDRFKMQPKREDGRPISGALVTIPISFVIGDRKLKISMFPGDTAVLVTAVSGKPRRGGIYIGCPSTADPARQCEVHPFDWAQRSNPAAAAPILKKVDQTTGTSLLECSAGADGALTKCKAAGATPVTAAALLEFAALLRAPAKTRNGRPMSSGRILIEFNWEFLKG